MVQAGKCIDEVPEVSTATSPSIGDHPKTIPQAKPGVEVTMTPQANEESAVKESSDAQTKPPKDQEHTIVTTSESETSFHSQGHKTKDIIITEMTEEKEQILKQDVESADTKDETSSDGVKHCEIDSEAEQKPTDATTTSKTTK